MRSITAASSALPMQIMMVRRTTVIISVTTASSALPMLPNATFEMYTEERDDDDSHDDDDEGDDCDDNHEADDKDDDSHDNYHRSILCITNASEMSRRKG